MPWRKGSVFDCSMTTWMVVGDDVESTAMSPIERCASRSYLVWEGKVNSPQHRKPKKARQQAAQSNILLLYSAGCWSKIFYLTPYINCDWQASRRGPCLPFSLLVPFKMSSWKIFHVVQRGCGGYALLRATPWLKNVSGLALPNG